MDTIRAYNNRFGHGREYPTVHEEIWSGLCEQLICPLSVRSFITIVQVDQLLVSLKVKGPARHLIFEYAMGTVIVNHVWGPPNNRD